MKADGVGRVCVLGAGTMGRGIAEVAATAGMEVVLHDIEQALVDEGVAKIRQSLDRAVARGKRTAEEGEAALARIRASTSLEQAARDADLVIEAVPEVLELKAATFRRLSEICRPDALLATNTSSLSVTAIAKEARGPERCVGMHFFNPAPVLKLLEVVRGGRTAPETLEVAVGVGRRMGKEPIVVKDSPGFASSRLGVALGLEAIRMVEEGVASVEDIDKAMELGYRHPMGPLRLTDLVGLDVRLAIAEFLHRELDGGDGTRFRPPQLLRRMVSEGKLGQKSGEGFYRWEGS